MNKKIFQFQNIYIFVACFLSLKKLLFTNYTIWKGEYLKIIYLISCSKEERNSKIKNKFIPTRIWGKPWRKFRI